VLLDNEIYIPSVRNKKTGGVEGVGETGSGIESIDHERTVKGEIKIKSKICDVQQSCCSR
jgi:hypothetical protein